MKNATYQTRIRIFIDLSIASTGDYRENVTMTASAWNSLVGAFSECAKYNRTLGCDAIAKRAQEISSEIYIMLAMRGFYKDCK